MKTKLPTETITQEDLILASEAQVAFERKQPPVWAGPQWDAAKTQAVSRHSIGSTVFWPTVVAIYRRLGGKIDPVVAHEPNEDAIQATGLATDVTDAPEWIMYAPGGTHQIRASKRGKPFQCTVAIDPGTANVLQASLQKINTDWHPQRAFYDFDHEGK